MGILRGLFLDRARHLPALGLPDRQMNILINYNGHGCLVNFGLLTIASDQLIVMLRVA